MRGDVLQARLVRCNISLVQVLGNVIETVTIALLGSLGEPVSPRSAYENVFTFAVEREVPAAVWSVLAVMLVYTLRVAGFGN